MGPSGGSYGSIGATFQWLKVNAEVAERIIVYNMGNLFTTSKIALVALKHILLMHPKNSEFRRTFFTLLCYTRGFKSTDPRDKLYAILTISDSATVPWESPEYTIHVSKLFVQYTK